MEDSTATSSGLFAVFLLSIYSLFLIPYTISYLCSSGEEDATTQPVVSKGKKKPSLSDKVAGFCTKRNMAMLLMWVVWAALLGYTQSSMASLKPFDPFEILDVPRDASDRDIKKAYRKLSLVYHPDKNPDPKAAAYFASYISKAYAALTDDVSRKNYEKYGHPDGPQGMNLGVALPSWMFSKDKKAAPLMLLGLVGCGILLPLGLMSWYMLSSSKFTGPNQIMNDTFPIFMYSKFCVKESQSLVRIPETLMCAMEFITLYTPPDHNAPLEELRKVVAPFYGELMARSNKAFWQRKAGVVKAHMLLLAHLERLGSQVPPALQADYRYLLAKCPLLLEEMLKIAMLPRTQAGTGWMTPSVACVEMMQCLAQGLPVAVRKGSGKAGDTMAPLLQLPGFDQELLKKLRKRKINSLADLQAMSDSTRAMELGQAGLGAAAIEGVAMFLSAMPRLSLAVLCEVEGEEEVMEKDPVHCKVRVLLSRPSHQAGGYSLRGNAVRAYTPHNPVPRDESWYFFLTEPSSNAVLAYAKVNLMEAEKQGLEHPEAFGLPGPPARPAIANSSSTKALSALEDAASKDGKSSGKRGKGEGDAAEEELPGQVVDMMFYAPKAATYNLSLVVMSDCWVGADESVQYKLKVQPLTRAVAEGRAGNKPQAYGSESEDDEEGEGSGSGSGSDSEDDYDSDETGEEESDEGEAAGGSSDGEEPPPLEEQN
ncbi:hypothetical protein OEZ86_013276 [Tetradesmus obliquus]|nr:hypothetical protein OEZ86_013276 [Tetradesmus obliquus]